METSYRLFVLFALANRKKGATIFAGMAFLTLVIGIGSQHPETALFYFYLLGVSLLTALLFTSLVYLHAWLIIVNREARRRSLPLSAFVRTEEYLQLLNEHSSSLEKS